MARIRGTPALAAAAVVVVAALAGSAWAGLALTSTVPRGTGSPSASNAPTATPQPTPTPTASPSPTPRPTPTPVPTPTLVPAPLTGSPVTEADAERHVIAVIIDDLSPARPQSGLVAASVVWQAPAEGGVPRYMALFQDEVPGDVGPVRSARLYFVDWAAEWDAVFAHVGGSPQALSTLSQYGRGQLVYNADQFRWGSYFWRITDRFAPHNVYTNGEQLLALSRTVGAQDGPIEPAWSFAPDLRIGRRPVGGQITVEYQWNRIRYDYDRETNTYLRSVSVEGAEHDAATGERIAPKNVIVMVVHFAPLNDGSGKGRLEADVVGSGTAWIATNGTTIKGTWKKTSLNGPTRFYDASGNQVALTIGQTFIQVVASGSAVTVIDGVPAPTEGPWRGATPL